MLHLLSRNCAGFELVSCVSADSNGGMNLTDPTMTLLGVLKARVSSGANVLASIQMLEEIGLRKRVVLVLPDRAER